VGPGCLAVVSIARQLFDIVLTWFAPIRGLNQDSLFPLLDAPATACVARPIGSPLV